MKISTRDVRDKPPVQTAKMNQNKQIIRMKTKQQMSYIMVTLFKPLNSEGIGPVSRLELKSKTLRFLNEPICFGIVPKSRL
jgi:hypothetical protein